MKIARLNKLSGNDGTIVATLYDTFPDSFDPRAPLWVEVEGLRVPLFAASIERRGRTQALIRFDDIDTPRRAAELLAKELFIPTQTAAETPSDGDLTGFAATIEGVDQGALVTAFFDGPNPLLELRIGPRTILVPTAFIRKINRRAKKISLSLPEGLLELS